MRALFRWCRDEWEKVVCALTVLLVLLFIALGFVVASQWWRDVALPMVRAGGLKSPFSEDAFAFARDPLPKIDLPDDHAMTVKPPPGWKPPSRPPTVPPATPETPTVPMAALLAQIRDSLDGTLRGIRVLRPAEVEPVPTPEPPTTPEPAPHRISRKPVVAASHPEMVHYQGFMRAPNGDLLALVVREDPSSDSGSASSSSYFRRGEVVGASGLTVVAFDDEKLILRNSGGRRLVVRFGQRMAVP